MSRIDVKAEPCDAGGVHGALGSRQAGPHARETFCLRCGLGWGDLVKRIAARYVPPADVAQQCLWRGSTYTWEFDDGEWSVYSPAPEGVTLLGDLPLQPIYTTYGPAWDATIKRVLKGAYRA